MVVVELQMAIVPGRAEILFERPRLARLCGVRVEHFEQVLRQAAELTGVMGRGEVDHHFLGLTQGLGGKVRRQGVQHFGDRIGLVKQHVAARAGLGKQGESLEPAATDDQGSGRWPGQAPGVGQPGRR